MVQLTDAKCLRPLHLVSKLTTTSGVSTTIRPAGAGDVNAICRIEGLSFSSDLLGIDLWTSVLQRRGLRTLVAEIRDEVCGYCLIHINDGKPSAYLHSLAITPEMKRRGLGRLLLQAAESQAAHAGRRLMRVDVRMDSPDAKAFYDSAGYRFVSIKAAHYQDGSSATRMDKRIAGREFGKLGRLVEKVVCAAAHIIRRRLR